jgi:glycosyltransferase involved in cell wall biosynthesis
MKPLMIKAQSEGSKIVVHNHGGMETHDIVSLCLGNDDTQMLPIAARNSDVHVLFNTEKNRADFEDFYSLYVSNSHVVGFPIRRPYKIDNSVRRILVPGRFCATKNTHLAAEILLPFREDVLFSTMHTKKCDYWRMLESLGYDVVTAIGYEFDTLLQESQIVFTASMSDSFNSSIAEAASFGSSVVAPYWGPFPEYVNRAGLYNAFDIDMARSIVERFLELGEKAPKTDVSKYHRDNFIIRVQNVLRGLAK